MMFSSSGRSRSVPHHSILLAAIVLLAAAAMTVLVPFEIPLTKFISAHRVNWFVELMGDSLFELEQPGGGDLVVIFLIVSVLLYVASSLVDTDCARLPVLSRIQQALLVRPAICDGLRRYRLRLEFLLVSSFCCSILMVKTLKLIMARPRPKHILFGGDLSGQFSKWPRGAGDHADRPGLCRHLQRTVAKETDARYLAAADDTALCRSHGDGPDHEYRPLAHRCGLFPVRRLVVDPLPVFLRSAGRLCAR